MSSQLLTKNGQYFEQSIVNKYKQLEQKSKIQMQQASQGELCIINKWWAKWWGIMPNGHY